MIYFNSMMMHALTNFKFTVTLSLHSCALLCINLLLSSTHTDSLTVFTLYINHLEEQQIMRFTLRIISIQAVYSCWLRSEHSYACCHKHAEWLLTAALKQGQD